MSEKKKKKTKKKKPKKSKVVSKKISKEDESKDNERKDQTDRHVEKLKEEKRKRCLDQIREIYDLYSRENGLEKTDFGITLRSLNLNPTEKDIQEIILEFPNSSINFDEYSKIVTDIVLTGAYKGSVMVRDSEDTILKAFETLDKDKKGYIETGVLMDYMKKFGEPFGEKELIEMTHAAEDAELHIIKYEDFSAMLSS